MSTHEPVETEAQEASFTPLYVGIGVAMLVLTLAAVFLVEMHLATAVVLPLIGLMAVVQVVLQLWLYMHLRGSRMTYATFFIGGACIALLIASALMVLIQQWA